MSSAATSAAASCYGGGQVRGRAFMSGGLGNPPHRGDLVPIPDDSKINGLGAFPICCWDARPPQSAAKVVLGTHKVLASGEGGWVFGVLCVLGAPLCERVSMLRMPDPIHPDLPCLFACATVPALCSVVIPDAWFPKSAPARFGCKQRKACNNTGVGYGGAVSTRSGGTPVRTVRAELACLSLSAARSGALLLKGPSSTEHWFPGSNLRSSKHPKL